jgi:hypothetical protein
MLTIRAVILIKGVLVLIYINYINYFNRIIIVINLIRVYNTIYIPCFKTQLFYILISNINRNINFYKLNFIIIYIYI